MRWKDTLRSASAAVERRPLLHALRKNGVVERGIAFYTASIKNPLPLQAGLILLYRMVLDCVYIFLLSPIYAYQGLTVSILPMKYICSWLILILFLPLIIEINQRETASSQLVIFMIYFSLIPLLSYYGCKGSDSELFVITFLYWLTLLLLQKHIPVLQLTPQSAKYIHALMCALTISICLFVLFLSGKYAGFRFKLDFNSGEYAIRAEAAAYPMSTITSYFMGWSRTCLILILLYWLKKRKYFVSAGIIVVYLFLYSIGAHKSYFLFLFLAVGCFFCYRKWMLKWISGLMTLVGTLSFVEYFLRGKSIISQLLFRRMMYVPANLTEVYYDFFSGHPLDLFRNGIMGKFSFPQLSALAIPYRIGEFNGDVSNNANNGLLSDVFANLPAEIGIFLLPLILVICFRLLDLVSKDISGKVLLPFCVLYGACFMSGSWSTTLLSDGFIVLCIFLLIYPRDDKTYRENGTGFDSKIK
ncbi:hypothetical protein AALA80_14765 [Oscillospiraceae bacterium 50-60]